MVANLHGSCAQRVCATGTSEYRALVLLFPASNTVMLPSACARTCSIAHKTWLAYIPSQRQLS